MFVIEKARLVYLATPKTASQSIREMLHPYADLTPKEARNRHINAGTYKRLWKEHVSSVLGFEVKVCAIMREPIERLHSWYRYRKRSELIGHEKSTHAISFTGFVEAYIQSNQPPFAQVGRQDRFMGYAPHINANPIVNYIFDYSNINTFVHFMSNRLGANLSLPMRNVSEETFTAEDKKLPPSLEIKLKTTNEAEFDLYTRVKKSGVLISAGR